MDFYVKDTGRFCLETQKNVPFLRSTTHETNVYKKLVLKELFCIVSLMCHVKKRD